MVTINATYAPRIRYNSENSVLLHLRIVLCKNASHHNCVKCARLCNVQMAQKCYNDSYLKMGIQHWPRAMDNRVSGNLEAKKRKSEFGMGT